MNDIRRLEYWLKAGRFVPLLILLILLNLLVFFWWKRHVNLDSPQSINYAVIDGLRQEKARVQAILDGNCDSPEFGKYRRGEIGPLDPQCGYRGKNDNVISHDDSSPKSQNQLVGILEQSTVRIIALKGKSGGTGSGFFISENLIVTNRHVIAEADPKTVFITSQYLGGKAIKVEVLATTPDSEFGNPDFALLKVSALPKPIKVLSVGDDPPILQNVYAAGYPDAALTFDSNDVAPSTVYSHGDVSVIQKQSNGMSLVVHGANISPGSSGGPLVNSCSTLVGVNTFLSKKTDYTASTLYALSAQNLRQFLDAKQVQYTKSSSECNLTASTQ